jgi:hypothetical protein
VRPAGHSSRPALGAENQPVLILSQIHMNVVALLKIAFQNVHG